MVVIWSASALGSEYGWGTFRSVLVRGCGRWQFLASQYALLVATALLWLVAAGVAIAVSTLVGGLASGDGISTSGQWSSVGATLGKSLYTVLPYIALTMLFVVLTSSVGIATGAVMGYIFIFEGVIVPILVEFVRGFDVIGDYFLGRAVDAWWGNAESGFFGSAELEGPLHGSLVMLAYIVVLSAATVWVFNRKDIGGPKGP